VAELLPARGLRIDPVAGEVYGARGRPLCGDLARHGYRYVLYSQRPARRISVHRLIWEAVHGPIPVGLQVNHRNGIKTDNRIENLELVTASENMRHAAALGLLGGQRGERHYRAKVTDAAVREIRRRRAQGERGSDLAAEFGISPQCVCDIVKGRKWRHVAEEAA
jgi:HNH endonuclease